MIRYDIYIKGKLWRSVFNEQHIVDIVLPYDEGEYEVKEFWMQLNY